MEYKYELHCHTGEVSKCAKVPAHEVVKLYKQRGYSGIVITDHYSPMTFPSEKIFCPQKAIDFYLEGYKKALELADSSFTVLLGMELRYYATANDFLVYGVSEDFLKTAGNLMRLYPKRFYKLAKQQGYTVLQAHPFRPAMVRVNAKFLDGTEIYNGKTSAELNAKALDWANKNNMKIRISGSDFHTHEQLAKGGIITNEPIRTNSDLLRVLHSGEFENIV